MPFLDELEECDLCEHRCGANRLAGETGICGVTLPVVASCQIHPAPPSSYTVFMAGCNFKCLNCQNWTISCYPALERDLRGSLDPSELARECVAALGSVEGRLAGADRIFFSGGASDIHLPYVEEVVRQARELDPSTKVNFDTNGYQTEEAFKRVLDFATSVTFDIKAFHEETHLVLTGASVKPVLRNAEMIGREHPGKLWEYRVLVIPRINEDEIEDICDFIASLDRELPLCFLAFRPNYALEDHPGASLSLMEACLDKARKKGLKNAHWSGVTDIPGRGAEPDPDLKKHHLTPPALLAETYALKAGCATHPRNCRTCDVKCRLKEYIPKRIF